MAQAIALVAGLTDRFTAVPKTHDIIALGVSPAAISTYNALADHANNLTGECYPMMKSLARLLHRAEKTIQRHIDELIEAGLVEKVKRRRDKRGRFQGWLYKLPHLAAAAARIRTRRENNRKAYEERKQKQKAERQARNEARRQRLAQAGSDKKPASGSGTPKRRTTAELAKGYEWLFGDQLQGPDDVTAEDQEKPHQREDDAREGRREYVWFFGEDPPEDSNGREQADFSTPSSGHQCPVGSNKSLTSSDNHLPPNPPRGAERDQSGMKDPATNHLPDDHEVPSPHTESPREGAGQGAFDSAASSADTPSDEGSGDGAVPRMIEELTKAEACWETIAGSLAAFRSGDLPGWFGYYRTATLDGSTLTVHLEDSPVRDGLWRTVGRATALTKRRYGEELARLWRELAEDEYAILKLVPYRPQGGPP